MKVARENLTKKGDNWVKTWGKWIVQLVIQEKSIPEGDQQEQAIWARLSFLPV